MWGTVSRGSFAHLRSYFGCSQLLMNRDENHRFSVVFTSRIKRRLDRVIEWNKNRKKRYSWSSVKNNREKKTTMFQKKIGQKRINLAKEVRTLLPMPLERLLSQKSNESALCVCRLFLIDIPRPVSQKPCKVRTRRIRSWKVNFTISGCYYVLRGFIVFDILSLDLSFGFNLKRGPNNLVDNQKQIKQH